MKQQKHDANLNRLGGNYGVIKALEGDFKWPLTKTKTFLVSAHSFICDWKAQ